MFYLSKTYRSFKINAKRKSHVYKPKLKSCLVSIVMVIIVPCVLISTEKRVIFFLRYTRYKFKG